jgi:predicted nucleic acid-binding protein
VKILIDTNIVLDLILEREPFVESAIALFEQIERGNLEGYIAATTITNIFYIIRKAEGGEVAFAAIHRLLTGLRFCAVDRPTVETALSLGLKDFEDSIQLACATLDRLDAIVTRDRKDFIGSNLPIYSPTELLNQL